MSKEKMIQIYNSLNQIEVKGYDNINRLFGVLFTLQQEISSIEEPLDNEK